MVNLHVDNIALELPASGLSRDAGQQLVREALELLAQRLAQAPLARLGPECRIDGLHLEGYPLESFQGPQGAAALCDALYLRLMEALP